MITGVRRIGVREEDGVHVYEFDNSLEAIDFISEQDVSAQIMVPLDGVWLSREAALIFCEDGSNCYKDGEDEVRVAVKETKESEESHFDSREELTAFFDGLGERYTRFSFGDDTSLCMNRKEASRYLYEARDRDLEISRPCNEFTISYGN